MNATLVDLAAGRGRPATVALDRYGDVQVPIPMYPPRIVTLARRIDPEPGDTPYVAFLIYEDSDDHQAAADRTFPPRTTPAQRLLAEIFHGVELEPELPTEVVVVDGGSIVRVELDEHLPRHVLLVPEALVS